MDQPADPYSETLAVPRSWWASGVVFVAAIAWAFLVATPLIVTVAVTVVAAVTAFGGLARYGAARVATDPDGFRAGRALLPYRYVGSAEPLDAEATRRVLGVEADARAYLMIRPYCHSAVRVTVDDPADPAPYWLVSTRHPAALAASLTAHTVRD